MANNSEIENRLGKIENRLEKIENVLFKENSQSVHNIGGVETKIASKVDDISVQHLVVISLKLKPKLTRIEIKNLLEGWGKVVGDWFRGGNFKNRLIKTNIVRIYDQNEKNKDRYILSKKGELLAEKLMKKYTINE